MSAPYRLSPVVVHGVVDPSVIPDRLSGSVASVASGVSYVSGSSVQVRMRSLSESFTYFDPFAGAMSEALRCALLYSGVTLPQGSATAVGCLVASDGRPFIAFSHSAVSDSKRSDAFMIELMATPTNAPEPRIMHALFRDGAFTVEVGGQPASLTASAVCQHSTVVGSLTVCDQIDLQIAVSASVPDGAHTTCLRVGAFTVFSARLAFFSGTASTLMNIYFSP